MRENRLRDGKLHGAIKEAQAEVSSLNLKDLIDNAYNDLSSLKSNCRLKLPSNNSEQYFPDRSPV